jgi:hypothetical protein
MHKSSPHYVFGREYLPYLYRLHARGEIPSKAALKLILDTDPDAATDPLMTQYLRDDAMGLLKRKRGRKPLSPERKIILEALSWLIPESAEEIRKERAENGWVRGVGDLSPTEEAAEGYARGLKMGTGRSLQNAVSAHRNPRRIIMNENSVRV